MKKRKWHSSFTNIWTTPTPSLTQGTDSWANCDHSPMSSSNPVKIENDLMSWGHLSKCLNLWIFLSRQHSRKGERLPFWSGSQPGSPIREKNACCPSLHLLQSWLDYEEMIVPWRGAGRGPKVSRAQDLFKNILVPSWSPCAMQLLPTS